MHLTPDGRLIANPRDKRVIRNAKRLAKQAGKLAQRGGLPAAVTGDLIDIEVFLTALCKALAGTPSAQADAQADDAQAAAVP